MSGILKNSIRIRAFQHTPSEPLGYFEQIFSEENLHFDYVHLWDDDPISIGDANRIIFLGGPMSVNDENEFSWIKEEKKLIREAVKKRIPVLGLCLGAQLIASAHGATVYRFLNETGWYPVHCSSDATGVFASFPKTFHVFQMHKETFLLPVGARLQFRGDRVSHQGFRLGSAVGLQFHLEMTKQLILDWTSGERKFLKEKIGRETDQYLERSNILCRGVAREFILGNFPFTQ
jgi:GMP synthase-like glutamine amidotransferase